MNKICVSLVVLTLLVTSCKDENANMQEEADTSAMVDTTEMEMDTLAKETPEMHMDSAAMQKAWEAYMAPGKIHEMLAAEEGTWSNDMTFWMGPNAEPQKATSTAEIKMIFGGRYQKINYSGDMMGMPFEGMATMAYDNASEELISTWIDNMGTGMLVMRGKFNEADSTITLKGSMVDPMTGKEIQVREVYTIVDENTRKMEMFYSYPSREEFKSMEIIMTRK